MRSLISLFYFLVLNIFRQGAAYMLDPYYCSILVTWSFEAFPNGEDTRNARFLLRDILTDFPPMARYAKIFNRPEQNACLATELDERMCDAICERLNGLPMVAQACVVEATIVPHDGKMPMWAKNYYPLTTMKIQETLWWKPAYWEAIIAKRDDAMYHEGLKFP